MSTTIREESNILYLGILTGEFIQKATPETPLARKIDYKDGDGKPLSKWCLVHTDLTGYLTDIKFVDGKFSEQLVITIDDFTQLTKVYLSVKSRYFKEFGQKIPNINLKEPVTLNVMDFIGSNGKPVIKFKVEQGGNVLYSAYWDNDKKKTLKGFPEMEGEWTDESDKTIYNAKVAKFLKKEIGKVKYPVLETLESINTTLDKRADEDLSPPDDMPF